MKSKYLLFAASLCMCMAIGAQPVTAGAPKPANAVPHAFKELKTGATIEAVREQGAVKVYMLIDDIEQYDQVMVERSDEMQINFSQCKQITIEKGKYKNNYLEVVDRYPLSPKMSNLYRIKTVTADGIMRMYPPVAIIIPEAAAPAAAGK